MFTAQMSRYFHVGVGQEQVCNPETTAEIRQLVLTAIKFVMEVVGDEALDEAFEEGVHAC